MGAQATTDPPNEKELNDDISIVGNIQNDYLDLR